MIRLRPRLRSPRLSALRLPAWTAHPGFGVAALFGIAVLLIVHGEPQPSSRPSGKSVVVSGSPSAPSNLPAILTVHDGLLESRKQSTVRRITLPDEAVPRSVLTNRGLSVVLAVADGRQRAYAITKQLSIVDLGFADAVLPAAAPASVLVESAVGDPGRLPGNEASPSPATGFSTETSKPSGPPELQNYLIHRYDSGGNVVGPALALPAGMRVGADTDVGLAIWQPANRVFDGSIALEPLSARAALLRVDGTERPLGPVYPLAATSRELLVWDVVRRQFGLMPLRYVISASTSTATSTATESASPIRPSESASKVEPTPTPTAVPGTRWFDRTRGFSVTGPASFSPDGSSFAVYAQVGSRRRLVVAQATDVQGNQVEVLALTAPVASATPPSTEPTTGVRASTSALRTDAASPSSSSAAPSASSSAAVFAPDGFPIRSGTMPLWTGDQVIGVGSDGTVVNYTPGSDRAALLDLGVKDLESLAPAP